MKRRAVPESKSISKENMLYNKALRDKKPFLIINRSGEHSGCKYDMEIAKCHLNSYGVF